MQFKTKVNKLLINQIVYFQNIEAKTKPVPKEYSAILIYLFCWSSTFLAKAIPSIAQPNKSKNC